MNYTLLFLLLLTSFSAHSVGEFSFSLNATGLRAMMVSSLAVSSRNFSTAEEAKTARLKVAKKNLALAQKEQKTASRKNKPSSKKPEREQKLKK